MDFSLSNVRGIGPARLKALRDAGLDSLRDLILFLPREYRDMTEATPLAAARVGQTIFCRVTVAGDATQQRVKKLTITKVYVTDGSDTVQAVWYNQPWLKAQLARGRELMLYGRLEARRGFVQLISPTIEADVGILPVYKPIAGVPQRMFRQIMEAALQAMDGQWSDELPRALRAKYELCERNFAMRNAHFPDSMEALAAARRRIAFEELLLYQVALSLYRSGTRAGTEMKFLDADIDAYWKSLSFAPTGAQMRVLREAADDMRSPHAMARLIQGDVGCGKTAIAFGAMALAVKSGYQAALMAPTEVLSRQHYESAQRLFAPMGIEVGLLTGTLTAKAQREAHAQIESGAWRMVIGTHALITDRVAYQNLGLVITDEQHRFGVRQRSLLSEKGEAPDVLVMSATPIPRTLSLILYGDLDLSIVDELPPGRTPVKTRIVPEDKRAGMYRFLRAEVKKGRQVYVVCPLVEDSEAVDALSAEKVYDDLQKNGLQGLRIALAHGKQRQQEKDAAIEAFRCGEADVLVSTTVIEVGVNVPNATVMVVENAERFGLAQLHQLRGRVGRGAHESWCFLMAEPNERLRILTQTNDGFVIAQKDMELRGPGELFGQRQSGALDAGLQAMAGDTTLLKITHEEARAIIKTPTAPDSRAVIALARETFADRLADVAMN
jgi:ATP-dependent DNA helicase RecG